MTPDRPTTPDPAPTRLICPRCGNRATELVDDRCAQCNEDLRAQDEFLKQDGPGKETCK